MGNTVPKTRIGEKHTPDIQGPSPHMENPLLEDKILTRVFSFLNVRNCKNCRVVCHKWKKVVEPILEKKSRILIEFRYSNDKSSVKRLKKNFGIAFPSSIDKDDVPLSSYKITGYIPLSQSKLENFFKVRKQIATELIIKNANINDLQTYNIKQFVGPNITRLEIHDDRRPRSPRENVIATRIYVPLQLFSSLDYISLRNCNVILNSIEISPKIVKFENVLYYRDKKQLGKVTVNEFINFYRISDLLLWGEGMELDLRDSINIDCLKVTNVPNWENCLWGINNLSLYATSFLKPTLAYIRNFESKRGKIDLSALPPSIEKLNLLDNLEISCSLPKIFLPNLKYLTVYYSENGYPHLFPSLLLNCHNLVEITIGSENADCYTEKFDLNYLPKSVKKLRLDGPFQEVVKRVREDLRFHTLLLIRWTLDSIINNLSNFAPTTFTFLTLGYDSKYFGVTDEADVIKIVKLVQESRGNIAIGSFWIPDKDFADSAMSTLVDKNGKYYLFENQRGKAMRNKEFYAMIDLNPL